MGRRLSTFLPRLNASVDWFIPAHLKQSRDVLQGVRMFLFSHLFGPILGHTISLSMLYVQGGNGDLSWWIFFLCVTAFWPFPFLLRLTGWYVPLALISIQNLLFLVFWGTYQYGGINSSLMPWLVTVPLLAFFYLPKRSTRIIVAAQIVANLALFYTLYSVLGFRETVAPHGLVVLGLISILCASVYVSMMALYFASIVSSQGELEKEVQRHLATERELRDATGEAKRALLAKSEFLAKMSHELKNPLNAIIGYSELLLEDTDESEMQKRKDLTSIRSAGLRLLRLIDDLLELSRLEAGKAEVRVEEVDFADFFANTIARYRASIAESGNVFLMQSPPDGRIACDVQKLQRVVDGLLSNATKFTKNGRILLTASPRDDTWQISIADTGIGIAQSRLSNLFDTFGTSDDETSSKYGEEAGLGLPLAYRYSQLMGGTLSIESTPGVGSTVTVTLPRKARVAQEPTAAEMEVRMQAA